MKILQINAVNGIRSTGRICVEIAEYLNKNGQEGYIAYASGVPYEKGYRIGTKWERKLHALFSRISGMQAYFSGKGTRKLLDYIEKIKPDVVHLHNLHSNYINLGILLAYLAENDIPIILTLHDCWFYTGRCFYYTMNNCFQWQKECIRCPNENRTNPTWFFDRCRRMYHDKKAWFKKIPRLAVVGVSDWVTNEARKSFLSSAKIITRIYNWIDLKIFKPVGTDELRRKLGLENHFVILGVASIWSSAKGLDKFIELADSIPAHMRIVLVGSIKGHVRLHQNIIHIQETHNVNELVQYYSMADVFVNFSPEETFGKVTAEALACCTPAIVINSTANPELIGKGCGYVVEANDINAVFDAISQVYRNGKEYYTGNCIAFAKENFNMENRIKDYFRLYHEISGKGRNI
ncbi:MAG: glycosyltransferase [Candidatus Margulisbacteria bacterium]|nr:glycosyltransferase [Candidatus Margulisiibacteriota bacterium]